MLKAHSVSSLLRNTRSAFRNITCMPPRLLAVRWGSHFPQAPVLIARPARALVDEQISIQGRFLPPHWPVTVSAHMQSDEGDQWEAFSHYSTDENGVINLTTDHSVGGSYVGCEPMGLFWAMQPAPFAREGLRLTKSNVESPYVVQLSLWEGHVSSAQCSSEDGQLAGRLAAYTVERWYMAPHLRRVEIRQNGVVGTLFLPSGPGPFPAMVDVWGLRGGLQEYRSALLASQGIASFVVAFYKHKDIPGPSNLINVGDDYFRSAYNLLEEHPEICRERIGLIGISYGAYIVLQMSTNMGIKPKCVIAINGPLSGAKEQLGNNPWPVNEHGFLDVKVVKDVPKENKVKLHMLECPLLYIVSEDDQSCASAEIFNEIEETLTAAGKAQLLSRLSYPEAGHLIEPPYTPSTRTALWSVKPTKVFVMWGGQLAPHAAAQEDAWKKVIHFIEYHLRR